VGGVLLKSPIIGKTCQTDLPEIPLAACCSCLFPCHIQCGKKHGGENGDNGNNNEKLNERERGSGSDFTDHIFSPFQKILFYFLQLYYIITQNSIENSNKIKKKKKNFE
jgi:hypothetical protein